MLRIKVTYKHSLQILKKGYRLKHRKYILRTNEILLKMNMKILITKGIEYSPLGELLSPEEDIKGVNPGALTGTTLPLVKAGQSLFNGYKVDLSDLPLYNEEFFQVFFQACKIRWRVTL